MPRMMKGDEEPEMTIGTIIFVAGLLFVFGIVFLRFTEFNALIKTDLDQIESVNMAHLAKKCFTTDGVVQEPLLTMSRKQDCKIKGKICVIDIESGKQWLECSNVDKPMHKIHAPLLTSDGNIHMGEISV